MQPSLLAHTTNSAVNLASTKPNGLFDHPAASIDPVDISLVCECWITVSC